MCHLGQGGEDAGTDDRTRHYCRPTSTATATVPPSAAMAYSESLPIWLRVMDAPAASSAGRGGDTRSAEIDGVRRVGFSITMGSGSLNVLAWNTWALGSIATSSGVMPVLVCRKRDVASVATAI